MAANSNQRQSKNGNAKEKSSKKNGKMIVFAVEIVVIIAMLAILYMVMSKPDEAGPSYIEIPKEELEIHEEVKKQAEEETGTMYGYMNIALFGVDAVNDKQLYKQSRSDTIMIASINLDTGEIRLVSVYRDTYLNLSDDSYYKCNSAYERGGAEMAIRMLNMNLDMNIENFITVGYKGLRDIVDGLGGIYVDVSESELDHLNNYQASIVRDVADIKEYTPVKSAGYQRLDGLQTAAYCRIRYASFDSRLTADFGRAARQREVMMAIEEQAKKADLKTLTAVFEAALPNIYTSLTQDEIISFLGKASTFKIVDQDGFPQLDKLYAGDIGLSRGGSSVVPLDLEENVVWLHKFLFDDQDYTVTSSVKEYSNFIKSDTASYVNRSY